MLSNLYIYQYNNYYNRTFKRGETVNDYPTPFAVLPNTNFNPNDCIDTTHTIRIDDCSVDYLLVVEDDKIVSRWFVIEAKRDTKGQWILTLHRDVIADFFELINTAPIFVEKAIVSEIDSAIFNNESMTFNQIKKSETALRDETGIPWIVGYYSRTEKETGFYVKGSLTEDAPYDVNINSTFNDWYYYKYLEGGYANVNTYSIKTYMYNNDEFTTTITNDVFTGYANVRNNSGISISFYGYKDIQQVRNDLNNNISNNVDTIKSELNTLYNISDNDYNYLLANNNKIFRFSDGAGGFKYYKLKLITYRVDRDYYINSDSGSIFNTLSSLVTAVPNVTGTPNQETFKSSLNLDFFGFTYDEILAGTYNYGITTDSYTLSDAPYGMFAIPYGQILIKNNGADLVSTNKDLAFKIAIDIGKTLGSNVYDIQLLPYCPVQQIIKADGSFDVMGDTKLYSLISKNSYNYGIIFNANISSFTLDIEHSISIDNVKISNECDMYRLCSPNYSGQFEFSAAKNNGVNRFNVDCTYKPYQPYIHINPDFNGLYGQDFNDARGLICSGDFSLPIVNDQWKLYQINNKNYQNIFDRQIENLEFKNNYQRFDEILGIASGSIGAGVSGGILGGVGGAIAGAVVSASLGGVDYYRSEQMRKEVMDYTKDQFGYQLGNIKAMPNSLAKTTAYTYNNKIFPILEYYTCTDIEKKALANKIKYNSMTIMRIGTISEFLGNSFKYKTGVNYEKSHLYHQTYTIESNSNSVQISLNLNDIGQVMIQINNPDEIIKSAIIYEVRKVQGLPDYQQVNYIPFQTDLKTGNYVFTITELDPTFTEHYLRFKRSSGTDPINIYIYDCFSVEVPQYIEDKGYFKGKLVRLESFHEDYHNINAIAVELDKGVYFK